MKNDDRDAEIAQMEQSLESAAEEIKSLARVVRNVKDAMDKFHEDLAACKETNS